ncbi:hypothetical protein D3C76_1507560 [compost metagenome]
MQSLRSLSSLIHCASPNCARLSSSFVLTQGVYTTVLPSGAACSAIQSSRASSPITSDGSYKPTSSRSHSLLAGAEVTYSSPVDKSQVASAIKPFRSVTHNM